MNRLCLTFALSLLLLPLTACGLSGGPLEGRVLEAGTNKPIPGAIVVARWQGTYSQIVDSQDVCYHVESTTTDAQGRYQIPAWKEKSKGLMFSAGPWLIDAYKTGYETYWPAAYSATEDYKRNIRYLKPFTGTKAERLKYLIQMLSAANCPLAGSSSRNLYPMYKAMYEEAKTISVTPENWKSVDILRQEAAEVAVRPDGNITSEEMDRRVNEFLKDNLK